MSQCRSCGAAVIWTITSSGKRMPLDAEPTALMLGVVAHNSLTGHGHVLSTPDRVEALRVWQEPGVTYHVSHFATCPNAEEHRR